MWSHALTLMYGSSGQVVCPVKTDMQRQQEANQHLIGKNKCSLSHMKGIASEWGGGR